MRKEASFEQWYTQLVKLFAEAESITLIDVGKNKNGKWHFAYYYYGDERNESEWDETACRLKKLNHTLPMIWKK